MVTLGTRLRALREEKGLTLEQVWSYVNILDTKSQTFLCCTSN